MQKNFTDAELGQFCKACGEALQNTLEMPLNKFIDIRIIAHGKLISRHEEKIFTLDNDPWIVTFYYDPT